MHRYNKKRMGEQREESIHGRDQQYCRTRSLIGLLVLSSDTGFRILGVSAVFIVRETRSYDEWVIVNIQATNSEKLRRWFDLKHAPPITSDRGPNEVRRRPGQEESLAPPCSNLRSLRSKCIALKQVLVTLLRFFGARGIVPPLPPSWHPYVRPIGRDEKNRRSTHPFVHRELDPENRSKLPLPKRTGPPVGSDQRQQDWIPWAWPGSGKRGTPPKVSSIYCCFVLREAVSQTKYSTLARLELTLFDPPCWLRRFPTSKSRNLTFRVNWLTILRAGKTPSSRGSRPMRCPVPPPCHANTLPAPVQDESLGKQKVRRRTQITRSALAAQARLGFEQCNWCLPQGSLCQPRYRSNNSVGWNRTRAIKRSQSPNGRNALVEWEERLVL